MKFTVKLDADLFQQLSVTPEEVKAGIESALESLVLADGTTLHLAAGIVSVTTEGEHQLGDLEVQFPAGTYVLGDPEKLLGDHVVAYRIKDKFKEPEALRIHGAQLWGAPLGGSFEDQNGIQYSGRAIAVIPVELVDDPHAEEEATIITATESFTASCYNGVIRVSEIVIVK